MYVITVEFVVKAEHAERFRARVVQQAAESLDREAGCHVFDVCCDPAQAERFLLYEVYEDEAAFDTHLESAHFRAFDQDSRDWVVAKTVVPYARVERT